MIRRRAGDGKIVTGVDGGKVFPGQRDCRDAMAGGTQQKVG